MTRQLEQDWEDARKREMDATLQAVYGGLAKAVSRAGGDLHGLTFKISGGDCLLVIKALMPAGKMVAFVGGEDLAACFRKGQREAARDGLKWREDRWG